MNKKRQPNIVYSMSDDQRHDYMGCAGHPFLDTPAMDRLAEEGLHFTNAFTAIPLCAPSRASHMTGVYPHEHGVLNNSESLNEGMTFWARLLQEAGYRTGFVGKIHFDNADVPKPGFDFWASQFGAGGQGHYFDPWFNVNGEEIQIPGYNSDVMAELALRFIEEEDDRPWALCLWYKAPHQPFDPPERYSEAYGDADLPPPSAATLTREGKSRSLQEREGGPLTDEKGEFDPDRPFFDGKTWSEFIRDYARSIRGLDDALGAVLDKLDEIGAADDTMVIHTSDHGYFHGEFGLWDKRWLHDPSIRVPLLIRYPDLIDSPGRKVDELILSLDLPATITDLAGAGVPRHYQGKSLRPLLAGEGEWHREYVLVEYFEDPPHPEAPTTFCLRTADAKLIRYFREGEIEECYDLRNDPDEVHNVIYDPRYRPLVEELRSLLAGAMAEFGAHA